MSTGVVLPMSHPFLGLNRPRRHVCSCDLQPAERPAAILSGSFRGSHHRSLITWTTRRARPSLSFSITACHPTTIRSKTAHGNDGLALGVCPASPCGRRLGRPQYHLPCPQLPGRASNRHTHPRHPIDHTNPLWLVVDRKVLAYVRKLPGFLGDNSFTRYNYRTWEMHDRQRPHEEMGDAFVIVTPARIWFYCSSCHSSCLTERGSR